MHVRSVCGIPLLVCLAGALSFAQSPTPTETGPAAGTTSSGAAAPAEPVVLPSTLLKPALSSVEQTLHGLKVDKWKKGSIRDQAGENVKALLTELQTNLPPILAAADAAPTSVGQSMPVMKHLDALYDVLLRVEEASRVVANGEQINLLQQALSDLSHARLAMDDHLQQESIAQEEQLTKLRVMVQEQAKAVTPKEATKPVEPCKPAPAVHHRKHTTKTTPAQTRSKEPGKNANKDANKDTNKDQPKKQ